jgi:glucose-1-phosphate adenylyltransferase
LHNHISNTYIFDTFSNGFVKILAAEQTTKPIPGTGNPDAVRKKLKHFHDQNADYYIILSGDQLYRMDLKDMLAGMPVERASIAPSDKP